MQPEEQNNQIITSQNMVPVTPIQLPEQDPDTSATSLLESVNIENQNAIKTRSEKATNDRSKSVDDVTKLMEQIGFAESGRGAIEESLGVDDIQRQSDDITSTIERESRALSREVESLYNNPNLSASLVSRRANRAQRETAAYVADLSIAQNVLSRNYDRAIATANRKVEMQTAPLKSQLEAKKFILDANKDLWTAQEKASLDQDIKKEERAYNEVKQNKLAVEDMRIKLLTNQAPQDIKTAMQGAETVEDILKIPGVEKYLMSPSDKLELQLKRAQISKIKQELSASNPDVGELVKINGADYIRYKDGTISEPVLPGASDLGLVSSRLTNKIDTLGKLTDPGVGLATSAGSVRGAPVPFLLKGKINDWRADVINTVQKLTVDELGRVKSDGVTFGALSNGERQAVGDAATALSAAMIYTGSGDDRRPTGRFKMSEQKVVEELAKIQEGYKLDFEKRMGVSYDDYKKNPEIVNDRIADQLVDSATPALEANNYGSYPTN